MPTTCRAVVAVTCLLLLVSFGAVRAQEFRCVNEVMVDAIGFAAAGERGASGANAAVLEALAEAVIQVRSPFMTVETSLVEAFRESFSDGELSIEDESTFARLIEERISGLVLRYDVIQLSESAGLVTARLRATVCNDARIALDWLGSQAARTAFEATLASTFGDAGWHVISASRRDVLDPLRASFDSGATHVATVTVIARDAGAYRDLRAYDVTFEVNVRDVSGGTVVSGLQSTTNVAARSLGEAESRAAEDVATSLANAILLELGASGTTVHRQLLVQGASRPNTSVELQHMLEGLPGVLAATLLDGTDVLRFRVETTRDMCVVASDLADERRLLIQVQACDASTATVRVLRE